MPLKTFYISEFFEVVLRQASHKFYIILMRGPGWFVLYPAHFEFLPVLKFLSQNFG